MKTKKAVSWERISEGIITALEIQNLEVGKAPISLMLQNVAQPNKVSSVSIYTKNGRQPKYIVAVHGIQINQKNPYKYLSCAVRRAVKEYKTNLRSGQWRMLVK